MKRATVGEGYVQALLSFSPELGIDLETDYTGMATVSIENTYGDAAYAEDIINLEWEEDSDWLDWWEESSASSSFSAYTAAIVVCIAATFV